MQLRCGGTGSYCKSNAKMKSTIVTHPEEANCVFRMLVAGTGEREVRMLELAPDPKDGADDSRLPVPKKLDDCSGALHEDNGSATDENSHQHCGDEDTPQSSDPLDLSLSEPLEANETHDSLIENSVVAKRPSLTSVDSGVVIEAEDLVSRPHTPAVEIEVLDKASLPRIDSPRIGCEETVDETALPVNSIQEDIVSWTLTGDYDENKPVSTLRVSKQRLFAQTYPAMLRRSCWMRPMPLSTVMSPSGKHLRSSEALLEHLCPTALSVCIWRTM
jgi:hypothetical protein